MPSTKPAKANSAASDREMRGLELFIRQAGEFRLVLVLHNDPVERDELIQELSHRLEHDPVQFVVADMGQVREDEGLLERVREAAASAPTGRRPVVMVVNLENRVEYNPELFPAPPETRDFLHTANLQRELFVTACPGPLVIWVTALLEQALVRQAPDLWHWRSHTFDLRTNRVAVADLLDDGTSELLSLDSRIHPDVRIEKLMEELVAYRQAGSKFDEMRILNAIGNARQQAGDAKLARNDFQAVRVIARSLKEPSWEAAALGNLGGAHAELGELGQAAALFEEARTLAIASGDLKSEAATLTNLGIVSRREARLEEAVEFHQKSLEIGRKLEDQNLIGNALINLANVYCDKNDLVTASRLAEERLQMAAKNGDLRGQARALGTIGVIHRKMGDLSKAIDFYARQETLAREIGDRRMEGRAIWNSALAHGAQGRHEDALRLANKALTTYKSLHHPMAVQIESFLDQLNGH